MRAEKQINDMNFKNRTEKMHLEKQIEDEKTIKEEYFLELQKLKQESSYLYQGGFGTFTIAFENPVYPKMVEKQKQLEQHRQSMDNFKLTLKGTKKKRQKLLLIKHEEKESELQVELIGLENNLENVEIQPLEKLCHFIEVGFQIA